MRPLHSEILTEGSPAESAVIGALADSGVRRILVAYSGGLDSTVLLHAAHRARHRLGASLMAVHVHHGLHPQADAWQAACVAAAAELGIPCEAVRVDARPANGESPEARARRLRYEALAAMLEEGDVVLTAHHRDDQVETLLLQCLRGAGPHGLAAMPRRAPLGRGTLVRPFLQLDRAGLRRQAEDWKLTWLDDPSNESCDYDRNYLRHEVLPRIAERWPSYAVPLARAAVWQAHAAEALDQLADMDLRWAAAYEPGCLSVSRVLALPPARRGAALRRWVQRAGLPAPNAAHVDEIVNHLLGAAWDATPCVHWAGAEVRRFRDVLHVMHPLTQADTADRPWEPPATLCFGGGRLSARKTRGAGLRASGAPFHVRARRGGEVFRPAHKPHRRTLKKLLQEAGVPPWERDRLPLIYAGSELAAVADLWVCESHAAGPDEEGWILEWQRSAGG